MAQPQWITPAGSLSTIPEGIFYQIPLQAEDPTGGDVFYQLIAGQLPSGIQVRPSGIIEGVPKPVAVVQGIPTEIAADVTSKFAIRAYTKRVVDGQTVVDRINDRTFTLTVAGQDIPEFVTPAGPLPDANNPSAGYYDGTQVSQQIEIAVQDPNERIVVSLISGALPSNLVLSRSGLISGILTPLSEDPELQNLASKNYQFTLEVTDGFESNTRMFSMLIYNRNAMEASTTGITADNTFITADQVPTRTPILLTPAQDLGRVRSDNFYAFQFTATDFDGDDYEFVHSGTLPPGLTLNSLTGWLYGYLPNLGTTENTYDFTVQVRKILMPTIISMPADFSMTVIGNVETEVIWQTPPDLGSIINGSVSTLEVFAVNTGGRSLEFRLASGTNSKLPQGLTLLPSGHIAGKVSFNTFALDGGTTTFDVDLDTRLNIDITTFDMQFDFTVNAYSPQSDNGTNANPVSVFRRFSITVVREYNEPFDSLYIKAMPPQADRALIDSLVTSQTLIPVDLVYRSDDSNFGVARSVIYNHAYGLSPASIDDYARSLDINHYWKNLILGEVKTAQALDANGNILYEVVYSQIIDNLVNNEGVSVGKSVELPYPVDGGIVGQINEVYPNSLINMRDQVIDQIGQISPALPLWMTSKQANNQVLGFVPAWVIAYVKPGYGGQVVYNIQQTFGGRLNIIDFKVDRYELNRSQSYNWDPEDDQWVPHPAQSTTFDVQNHYQLIDDSSFAGGVNYAVNDRIGILGSAIGGINGANNVAIVVTEVNGSGTILSARVTGTAPILTVGDIYTNIAGTNFTGSGSGATWDLVVEGQTTPTIFDGSSTRFIAPADRDSSTDIHDAYLLFPRINILSPYIPSPSATIVGWKNAINLPVTWRNNSAKAVNWKNSGG